jgi:hypothetical protein
MAGISDKMGFSDPTEGGPNPPGSKMGLPTAGPRAVTQLNASEPLGIAPAKPPEQQAQYGGPRLGDMLDGISEGRPGGSIPDLHQGGAQRGRNLHAAAHGRAVRLARPEARPDGPPRHGARLTARTHKISPDGIILDQRQPEWHTVVLRRTKRLRLGSGR